jgi:4-methylaminobutanoate oxidase (formaldehyde-forming)
VRAETISPGEAKERWPLMNGEDVIGAVWSPDDGRVNPSDLCAALVKGARAGGARIFEETPVTAVRTQGGRIAGIETPKGFVKCDAIALCAGLWSREAAALAGVEAPVQPCEHFYLLTKPVPGAEHHLPTLSDHDSHLYIRDESQGLLVGCFEPLGKPLDPAQLGADFAFQLLPEDWDHFEPMMLNALHRLPVLETAEVRMLLNGPEGFTPDGSFLLGEAAETRGVFLGCGMNSVGVATGGGAGMALAHAILHGRPPKDLHEADPMRFPAEFQSLEALMSRAPEVEFQSLEALMSRAPEVLGAHYEIAYPGRQFTSARDLRKTPLDARWRAAKARFGQFYAWERPLFFDSEGDPGLTFGKPAWFDQVGREVARAHEGAAIFDQSTFGKIRVEGPDAERFLDRVCANDMTRPPGRAIYTAMLNEAGGTESDLTALRLGDEVYRLYVGTGAIKRDLAWLSRHLEDGERASLTDETADFAVLALMGPKAAESAAALGGRALARLGYFRHAETELAGIPVRAARLSYVGEAGWEITCRTAHAEALYDALAETGARPAGLFAQTAMRIEKRFLAMGHDLDGDITPLEAGLDFAVAWDRDFIGRSALLERRKREPDTRMTTLLLDDQDAVPLGNEPVTLDGEIVGQTTSAAYGYRVGRPLALAYVEAGLARDGARLAIDIAGTSFDGTVSTAPAFDPEGARMRAKSPAADEA